MSRQARTGVFVWGLAPLLCAVALAVGGLVCLPGCASTNPVAAASTLDQRAYALYGTFVIVEEQGARLVSDPAAPGTLKSAIRSADARAKPTADTLVKMLQQYETAAAAVKSGSGAAGAAQVASANLALWITQATTDIGALVSAVKGNSAPEGT